jgi:hypothetical protein
VAAGGGVGFEAVDRVRSGRHGVNVLARVRMFQWNWRSVMRRRIFGRELKIEGVKLTCGRQNDPNWRDNLLFYEYFHGDNGAGIGASHQTGWTGLVAPLIEIFGHLDAETFLTGGREAAFQRD